MNKFIFFLILTTGIVLNYTYGKDNDYNLRFQDKAIKVVVDSLLNLSDQQQAKHPKKAFNTAKEALLLIQQNNKNDSLKAMIYYQMGRACFFMGLNDSSVYYFHRALNEPNINFETKGKVFNSLSMVYRKSGKFQQAINFADSALVFYIQQNDSVNINITRFNKAKIYFVSGNLNKANEMLFSTLKDAEQNDDELLQVEILGSIANVYMDLGKTDKAKTFYLKAIDRYNLDTGNYVYANILNNYGTLFYEKNNFDSAMTCYKKALNIYKNAGQEDGIAIASQNLGITYVFLGQPQKGIRHLKSALNTFTVLHLKNDMASALVDLGTAYMESRQYDSAEVCFYKVINITSEISTTYYKKQALKYLYKVKQKTGDYQSAFEIFNQYIILKDSLNNLKMQRNLQELEVKYQTAQREKEILHLKDQKLIEKVNNQFLIGAIISLISISLLLLFGLWTKRKKDIQLHKQKLLVSEKEKILIKEKLAKQQAIKTRLETEIEYKSRQLASHALNMMKKNKLLQSLTKSIDEKTNGADENIKRELKDIKQQLQTGLNTDKDWELFKLYFEQVNDAFFDKLKAINPNLTSNDYKLCALIKLNMNIKEMAAALNISPDSLKNARYRLKRKLKLDNTQKLNSFIINL